MGIIALFILFYTLTSRVYASVTLNEFAVQPAQTVEIVNTSSESADISGWYIDDSGGSTFFTIAQNTVITPNSCIVISGSFNLNSASSDSVRLFDNTYPPTTSSAQLIDQYYYVKAPAVSLSIGKVPDGTGNWTEQPQSFGQWNESNTSCLAPTPTPIPTSTPSPTPQITPTPTPYPDVNGITIIEIYPYPNTNEKEWVKIENTNTYSVELVDWFIDDKEDEGSSPIQFSASISPHSHFIIELARSILNNNGDVVRLLNKDGIEKDLFEYAKCTKGQIISVSEEETSSPLHIIESQYPSQTVPLLYQELERIHIPNPPRIITFQPPFFIPTQKEESQVLGINTNELIVQTELQKRRFSILLLIPGVNSVLTIVSLFIKMNHA